MPPSLHAKVQHALWVLTLPDGSTVIVREEEHGLGGSPCSHRPPAGVDVWHYNIEYQRPNGYRNNKTTVFNLHMAVWKTGSRTCFSCWNVNPIRCVVSNCMDGDQLQQTQDAVREVATSVVQSLSSAAEFGWQVALGIGAAILFILSLPFRGAQMA